LPVFVHSLITIPLSFHWW